MTNKRKYESESSAENAAANHNAHVEFAAVNESLSQQPDNGWHLLDIERIANSLMFERIANSLKTRGKVILEEVVTSVTPIEERYPEHRHLFVDDNGTSSSREIYNKGAGICKDSLSVYSPTIRRIIYFKEKLFDANFSTASERISPSSPLYKFVLRDVDGHYRYVNGLHGNSYCPNVLVTTYKKLTYENGAVTKHPIMTDVVEVENNWIWDKTQIGDYFLKRIHDTELIEYRKNLLSIRLPGTLLKDYTNFVSGYVSDIVSTDIISQVSSHTSELFAVFLVSDMGGFGSFYFKLALLCFRIYKD